VPSYGEEHETHEDRRRKEVRKVALASAAAAVLAAPVLAGITDPNTLIQQATAKVRAKAGFKNAVLLEADGTPRTATAKVRTMAGITKWRFVYNNQGRTRSKYRSVAVYYPGWRIVPHTEPFVEDKNITAVPKLTAAAALAKLRAAGKKQAFAGVTLRYPLRGYKEPLWIFTMGSNQNPVYWYVGTKTGKIGTIS
jgi:hypothetical protein